VETDPVIENTEERLPSPEAMDRAARILAPALIERRERLAKSREPERDPG
jgi:hypothetical protein